MESEAPPPSQLLRRLIDFDTELSLRLYTIAHPILPYSLLKSLEISGDGRLFFPVVVSLLLTTTAATVFLIDLLLAAVLDLALIGLLKHLIRRPRPVYNQNMFLSFSVDHWSFPSGHSSRVFFIATMFYLSSDLVQRSLIEAGYGSYSGQFVHIVGAWAVITSGSRVLLGRHFVLDVVAGACLGVLEGIFSFQIFNYGNLMSFIHERIPIATKLTLIKRLTVWVGIKMEGNNVQEVRDALMSIRGRGRRDRGISTYAAACYHIWKTRNCLFHRKEKPDVKMCFNHITSHLSTFWGRKSRSK
ncbi:unnamed protein product [Cuscuta campestris]|uniref:Phosphatidic acid phosphatase type 2/haloperoxidase domain-containing protein n=1 Tax=Cuscuta campestris TaxID=132261 RepID=A0A484NQM0_9ASTE|nr:unnamed protein product [Cuscuta campestris]